MTCLYLACLFAIKGYYAPPVLVPVKPMPVVVRHLPRRGWTNNGTTGVKK